uniref:CYCLIN domain-containing protein n=1 Tax=Parastrongyloides trichosuri TaxID=131310 RepID=A0A0N4ZKB1_PARTI
MKLRKRGLEEPRCVDKQTVSCKRPENCINIKKTKLKNKSKNQKGLLQNIKSKILSNTHVKSYTDRVNNSNRIKKKKKVVPDDIFKFSENNDPYQADNLYLKLSEDSSYHNEYIFNKHIDDEKTLKHQVQLYENMIIYLTHICSVRHTIGIRTFYLALSLIQDIFRRSVIKNEDAIMISIVCMFLASKFEDVYPLSLDNCVELGDEQFTKADVALAEQEILAVTEFRMVRTYSIELARQILDTLEDNKTIKQICDIICICCTFNPLISSEKPSVVASSIITICHSILNQEVDSKIKKCLSYTDFKNNNQIIEIIRNHIHSNIPELYNKYGCFRKLIEKVADNELFSFVMKFIH